MRNDADEMRFADRRDLHHLRDSAYVRQRGADIIDVVVFHQTVEIPAISPFLSGGDRHLHHFAQLRKIVIESLGPHRVLNEKRRERFDQVASADRVRKIEALVEVDAEIAILTDAFPNLDAILVKLVYLFARVVGRVDGRIGGPHAEGAVSRRLS